MRRPPADWFSTALEIDPTLLPTRITLGEMQANAGDFAEAVRTLRAGLPAEGAAAGDPELVRQLALTLERDFQTAEAVALWQAVAARPDADAFTLEEAADALARNQDYAGARTLFESLADDQQGDPYQTIRYKIRIARLWEAEGDFEKALDIYQSAVPQTSGTSWIQKELRSRIEQVLSQAGGPPRPDRILRNPPGKSRP